MHQTPCPGSCNNAWRRAETIREEAGTEHHLTPTWGRPVQCDGCTERARQHLTELPELLTAVQLEALHGTHSPSTSTIGSRSSDAPAWPGQAARLLLEAILGEMEELESDVLHRRGIWAADAEPARDGVTEGRRITDVARILGAHLGWMMQHHPAAGEPHDRGNANPGGQIRSWHSVAQRFIKAHPQHDVRKLAPCPGCKGPYLAESRDLRLVGDRPYIECRDPGCQRILTSAEYDAYVKALAAGISAAA
ncbi:hypothetical protein ACIQU4_15600 [Streptomyces sp. NPDC090741]|uniref:hypothetical protein n=1 Tax=Streptomyces sp. NPDC090741 TaxID=3365967 RepID=UPI00381F9004